MESEQFRPEMTVGMATEARVQQGHDHSLAREVEKGAEINRLLVKGHSKQTSEVWLCDISGDFKTMKDCQNK